MKKRKPRISRNALQRERICAAIGRKIALENLSRRNSKREAWARMAIGLKPFPTRLEMR